MKKKLLCLLCMLLVLGSASNIYAEDSETEAGSCSFTGSEMISSFDSNKIAVSVSEMEPGDTVTFSVDIHNESDISTNWYMSNDVLSSLEDAQSVAENGGYTYLLTYTDVNGEESVIYSSESIGGEKDTSAGVGLNEATDSLDEFFYLKTLEPGDNGKVYLKVGLDGESQGNIYQDTLAKLMMNFAVEDNSNPTTPNPPTYTTPTPKVKTGDVWYIASIVTLLTGILLLVVVLIKRKGEQVREKAD